MLGSSVAALACPLPVEQDWRIRVSPRRSGSSSSRWDKAAVLRACGYGPGQTTKTPEVEGQSRGLVPGCTGGKEHPGTPSEVAEGHWGNDW